jgi:hypothetical protein
MLSALAERETVRVPSAEKLEGAVSAGVETPRLRAALSAELGAISC